MTFDPESTDLEGFSSSLTVTFPDADAMLTPGVMPKSLDPLEGFAAPFSGENEVPSAYFGGNAIVASALPELSSIVTPAIGLLGLAAAQAYRSRRRILRKNVV